MSYKNFPLLVGGRGFGKVAAMKARISELERDTAALHKKLAESELKVKEPTLFQQLYLTSPAVSFAIKAEIRKIKYGIEQHPSYRPGFKLTEQDLINAKNRMRQEAFDTLNAEPLYPYGYKFHVIDEPMCANEAETCDCGYHKVLRGHEGTPYLIPYLREKNNGTSKSTG